ncbi:hypothetical protein [Corallococcus sp. 4LFB]|uniref:hypothetical protein n=1 Tax=Corallococcus sp. 4LFB TaxID=3383249 RepID=UPI0039760CF5
MRGLGTGLSVGLRVARLTVRRRMLTVRGLGMRCLCRVRGLLRMSRLRAVVSLRGLLRLLLCKSCLLRLLLSECSLLLGVCGLPPC